MIQSARQAKIPSMLQERPLASTKEFRERIDRVSAVAIRKEIASLAERGALIRTRGGAMSKSLPDDNEAVCCGGDEDDERLDRVAAILLPPIVCQLTAWRLPLLVFV
jgi:DeoR/GlpR family transcriptional regulator of sugar metabolism